MPVGRQREHRATRSVQIAREHIQHVDQPAGHRSVLGCRGPDASVDRRRTGLRQLVGELPDDRGIDAASRRHHLGRERPHEILKLVEPVDVLSQAPERDEVCGEELMGHAEQEIRVRAGSNRHVAQSRGPWPYDCGVDRPRSHDHRARASPSAAPAGPERSIGSRST